MGTGGAEHADISGARSIQLSTMTLAQSSGTGSDRSHVEE